MYVCLYMAINTNYLCLCELNGYVCVVKVCTRKPKDIMRMGVRQEIQAFSVFSHVAAVHIKDVET